MKLSKLGRISLAFVASVAVGLGMTACGGGTIGFMYVPGTQYNQIAGFKIDDFTGNLTTVPKSPFQASGTNPRMIVIKPGGRYLYVINAGAPDPATKQLAGQGIAEFSVGGDGILTFQEQYTSQGQTPVWAAVDGSGNFLYVLDSLSPAPVGSPYNGLGAITVFAIDPNTGRLSLVTNNQIKDPANPGVNLNYFPVGKGPTMVKTGGGSCLYTLDAATNSIFPYSTNSGTGQLTLTTNSEQFITNAGKLTSINAGGSYIYLTDAAPVVQGGVVVSQGGQILPFTPGSNCSLNSLTGGPVNNLPLTSNPVWSLTDNRGRYLYVLNQSTTNSNNANSSISAFSIDPSTGKLQQLSSDTNNPYPTGSGPVCMAEDPTNQYVYTSNSVDGTVTGKIINQNTGQLSDLQRGSKFTATGVATCLAISGSVY